MCKSKEGGLKSTGEDGGEEIRECDSYFSSCF